MTYLLAWSNDGNGRGATLFLRSPSFDGAGPGDIYGLGLEVVCEDV